MTIAALVVLLLIHIVIHEAAHALAMRRDGVRIITAGLGPPIRPVIRISRWRGINWTISPWLVGAFVEPHHDQYREMELRTPYRRLAWHYNAGIIANILGMLAALAGLALVNGAPLLALVAGGAAVVTWCGREYVAAYICPALAPVMLAVLVGALVFAVMRGQSLGFFTLMDDVAPRDLSAAQLLSMFAMIGFAVAVANLAPLFPADNARVLDLLMRKRFGPKVIRVYQVTGSVVLRGLMVVVLAFDAYSLIF